MTTFAVDLSSERLRGDDGAHARWLRESAGPVLRCTRPAGVVVLAPDLVRTVLTEPGRYSSAIMSRADTQLLGADGEQHRRVRRALIASLRTADPVRVARRSAARARRLLAAFAGRTDTAAHRAGQPPDVAATDVPADDAIARVARPLAVLTAAQVLGLPVPVVVALAGWARAAVGSATTSGAPSDGAAADIGALSASATTVIGAALPSARRGLLGRLRAAVDAGEQTTDGAVEVALLVLIASLDTTTALIGHCLHAVAGGADTASAEAIVDQVLAGRAPVRFVRRVATCPHELASVPVAAGQPVIAHLRGAATLAFGAGPHACPGALIARAVAGGAVTAAADYRLQPAGPPTADRSAQIDGYATLPLHASLRSAT